MLSHVRAFQVFKYYSSAKNSFPYHPSKKPIFNKKHPPNKIMKLKIIQGTV